MTTVYIVKVLRNSTYSPQCWQESRTTRRKAETTNRARVFMFRFGEEFISLVVLAAQLRIRPPFCSLTRLRIPMLVFRGRGVPEPAHATGGSSSQRCVSDFTRQLDISPGGSFIPWKLVNATNHVLLSWRIHVKHFLGRQWESFPTGNTWWERHFLPQTPYNPKVSLNMGQGGLTGP